MIARQNLKTEYRNNVRNYTQIVMNLYETYQKNIVEVIAKQPETTFLQIVFAMGILYPCFYRMEEITGYQLQEFSYENVDLLANQRQSCDQIAEMLGDLFSVLKPYLRQPIPVTNQIP